MGLTEKVNNKIKGFSLAAFCLNALVLVLAG